MITPWPKVSPGTVPCDGLSSGKREENRMKKIMMKSITFRLGGGYNHFAVVAALALAFAGMIPCSSFAGMTPLFTDGLQVQFTTGDRETVDCGINLKHGSPISYWQSEPGCASPLTLAKVHFRPNWQTNAFRRADGTFRPAVRFIRNANNTDSVKDNNGTGTEITQMYLASTNTTLNLGAASTWFLVMNNLIVNNQKGLFGFDGDPRFGAFFIGSDNQLRLHNNANPGNNSNIQPVVGAANLIDSRGTGSRMTSGLNGSEVVNIAQSSSARSAAGPFVLGRMIGVNNSAAADIAEVIVYNRAMNDAEVRIVRNALAARWGLTIANPLWTAAADGFCDDLVGVGSSTATGNGRIPGAVETSGNAGGLSLSVPSGALAGTDGYLLMAHDGAGLVSAWDAESKILRIARVWRVQNTLATTPAVTVSVDGATIAPGVTGLACRLLYRADATRPFADTGLAGVPSGTTVSFAFAAGAFKAGDYAVAITGGTASATVAPGTEDITVWFTPDAGVVTNESGAVTNWVNQGSVGAVSDLHAYTGTVTVAENALTSSDGTTTHNALRFATACLMTEGATSHGLQPNQLSSWFIVYEPSFVADEQRDAGLFGFNNNNARYGAFFRNMDGGYNISGFQGGYPNNELARTDIPKAWHVVDMTQYPSIEGATRGSIAARGVTTSPSGAQPSYQIQTTANFKVGHFREDTWGKFFNGGIAELRIYSRPLNPIERMYVAKELSDKYGLAFNHPFWNASSTDAATYRTEIQMTGLSKMTGTGGATGFMSGGMTISTGDAGGDITDIWFAHNGESLAWTTVGGVTALARSWCLTGLGVTLPSMRLTFLLGGAEDGSEYAVLFRESDAASWMRLPVSADVSPGMVSVNLPAGLPSGYITLGKVGAGETLERPCAAVGDGLMGWYRADTGVTVAGGVVTTWRNLGLVGSAADFTASGSPRLSTSAFPRASGLSEASVSFDGSSYMTTAEATKWYTSWNNNNTWFAVFRLGAGVVPSNMGVFGEVDNNGSRFGAFFVEAAQGVVTALRTHAFVDNNAGMFCVMQDTGILDGEASLIDSCRLGKYVDSYLDGRWQDGKYKSDMSTALPSRFYMGKMLSGLSAFNGDIAEVRVYNRTLKTVERNIVANHLAARYGIALRDNLLYGGATDGCVLDVVGIGRTIADGSAPNTSNGGSVTNSWSVYAASNITVSDNSAGLTLSAAGTLADGDYVLAGHGVKDNAWVPVASDVKRLKRAWHITKTNAASLDLALAFTLADAGVGLLDAKEKPVYGLFRSLDGGATWSAVDVPLVQTAGGFTCTLPASAFAEGQYTLGAHVTPLGTMVIFR